MIGFAVNNIKAYSHATNPFLESKNNWKQIHIYAKWWLANPTVVHFQYSECRL